MPLDPEPKPPTFTLDLRCSCGGLLYVEMRDPDPYANGCSLGKAWMAAHQKCAGLDFTPSTQLPMTSNAHELTILRAAQTLIDRDNRETVERDRDAKPPNHQTTKPPTSPTYHARRGAIETIP